MQMKDMEGELERRTLTYSRWESSDSKGSRGWHPAAFDAPDIALDFIKEIQVPFRKRQIIIFLTGQSWSTANVPMPRN